MSLTVSLAVIKSFWVANGTYILGALLLVSEALANTPVVKANSNIQLIMTLINKLGKK